MMIVPKSIILAESIGCWRTALNEAERSGICGLFLSSTGPDPICHEIRLVCLALPGNCVHLADPLVLGDGIISDLVELIKNAGIKKVLYDAKTVLSFLYASKKQKLVASNLFDLMLASEICWSGYYDLSPSCSPKNRWTKKQPDHSLAALAERHLGVMISEIKGIEGERVGAEGAAVFVSQEQARAAAVLLPIYRILDELLAKSFNGATSFQKWK